MSPENIQNFAQLKYNLDLDVYPFIFCPVTQDKYHNFIDNQKNHQQLVDYIKKLYSPDDETTYTAFMTEARFLLSCRSLSIADKRHIEMFLYNLNISAYSPNSDTAQLIYFGNSIFSNRIYKSVCFPQYK